MAEGFFVDQDSRYYSLSRYNTLLKIFEKYVDFFLTLLRIFEKSKADEIIFTPLHQPLKQNATKSLTSLSFSARMKL